MASRKRLAIHDIEDEEDTHNRIVERQVRKKQKVKLSFADDDDDGLEPPVMLSRKVKVVETKLQHMSDIRKSPKMETPDADGETALIDLIAEDLPTVVESALLQSESLVDSIPNIENIAKVLVSLYERLSLHILYDTAEENSRFRLFLYAVAHRQEHFWPKDATAASVLKRLLTSEQVRSVLSTHGIPLERSTTGEDLSVSKRQATDTRWLHTTSNCKIPRCQVLHAYRNSAKGHQAIAMTLSLRINCSYIC